MVEKVNQPEEAGTGQVDSGHQQPEDSVKASDTAGEHHDFDEYEGVTFEVVEGEELEGGRKIRRRGIYLLPNLFTTGALFSGFYAIVAAMNGFADDKGGTGRAVIRAERGVLRHPAPEFGKRHDHHVVAAPQTLHVADEGRDMVRGLGPQPRMGVFLIDMGVEGVVAKGNIVNLRREIGGDQRRQDAGTPRQVVHRPHADGFRIHREVG